MPFDTALSLPEAVRLLLPATGAGSDQSSSLLPASLLPGKLLRGSRPKLVLSARGNKPGPHDCVRTPSSQLAGAGFPGGLEEVGPYHPQQYPILKNAADGMLDPEC